jgi:outer membrane autotransporter protein
VLSLQNLRTICEKTILILSLSVCSYGVQAQSNALKINAASLAVQTGSVFFEHALAIDRSLNMGLFVTNFTSETKGSLASKTEFKGFGLTAEYRLYSEIDALRGFFFGPYLRVQNYNFTETSSFFNGPPKEDKAKLTTFGGGAVLGWQGIIKDRVSIEPFLGLGYAAGEVDNLDDNNGTLIIKNGLRGLELRPGLSIGIVFGPDVE